MKIKEFKVESWLNPRAHLCKYNFGSSCVRAFTVEEMFDCIGKDVNEFLEEVRHMSLFYGQFFGFDRLLAAISKLYRDVTPEMILTVHGGTGANNMVITELVEPGDNVVAIFPNYQQHYSIPESLGAEVRYLELREEDGYLPDLDALAKLVDSKTRMITLSNPNNPTGINIDEEMLRKIGEIAAKVDAYVLCDEIYRGLEDEYMASIVDVYEKGIVTSSMSKVYALSGSRLGWIVTRDPVTHKRIENRRSYDTICIGFFDEYISAIALENCDAVIKRSKKIVRDNKAILEKWIETQPRIAYNANSVTPITLVKYDYDIDAERMGVELFEKASALVTHGDCFEIPKSFRIGFGHLDTDLVQEGLESIGNYLKTLK